MAYLNSNEPVSNNPMFSVGLPLAGIGVAAFLGRKQIAKAWSKGMGLRKGAAPAPTQTIQPRVR
jgi:hypothetical protein